MLKLLLPERHGRAKLAKTIISGATYIAQTEQDVLGRPWLSQGGSGRWTKVEFNARSLPSATCDVGLNPEDSQAGCRAIPKLSRTRWRPIPRQRHRRTQRRFGGQGYR